MPHPVKVEIFAKKDVHSAAKKLETIALPQSNDNAEEVLMQVTPGEIFEIHFTVTDATLDIASLNCHVQINGTSMDLGVNSDTEAVSNQIWLYFALLRRKYNVQSNF